MRVKRQISIIISSALVLFLASTFFLVAMLPSPNEQRFPAIVIRSPVTNMFVRNDDKSSSSQQLLRHQKESLGGGKSYASTPISRSNIAAQRKETTRLTKESIAAQTIIQADRSSGEGSSQNEIGDDDEISSDKSEAVAETTDPAKDEGNNQNEIGDDDDEISKTEIGGDDDGISSDKPEAVAETTDSANDEANSQNNIGDDDDEISADENSQNEMYDDEEESIDESQTRGDHPRIIHILETRFMQDQPNLVELANARLHLFKTICLPSVIHQTAWGNFVWIIRTDPELQDEIKKELIHILNDAGALTNKDEDGKEKTLTYVIGSNDNYVVSNVTALNVRPFDIRAMLSDTLSNPETIFVGKTTSIKELLDEVSQPRFKKDVVIWTRLDADDGLNIAILQYLQDEAIRYFIPEQFPRKILTEIPEETPGRLIALAAGIPRKMLDKREKKIEKKKRENAIAAGLPTKAPKSDEKRIIANVYTPPQWSYWCAGRNLDWFVTDPVHDPQHKNGTVYPVVHVNMCVTPGVTIALRGSFDPKQIPRLDHDKIIPSLRPYGGGLCERTGRSVFDINEGGIRGYQVDDGSCFHLVTVGIAAIRSRTPTSAGMLGVNPDFTQREYIRKQGNLTGIMWKSMFSDFFIRDRQLVETNLYFADHIYDIAEENARGQCTTGHSCKVCAYFAAINIFTFILSLTVFFSLKQSSSKDSLQRFVDLKGEAGNGFDVVSGGIVSAEKTT